MSIISKATKKYCEELLTNSICSNYQFHNVNHTLEVYKSVLLIADSEGFSSEEKEILAISAMFHDTGYSKIYTGHEYVSVEIAEKFLFKKEYNEKGIQAVLKCIAATKMPQEPTSNLEKIICDADLAHLSAPNYLQRISLLRKEWSYFLDMNFSNEEWVNSNIEFLKNHNFHTLFGKTVLETSKLNILVFLKKV